MGGKWQQGEMKRHIKKAAGQGVVEYAGALVIAAGIIAAGIIIVPPNFASFMNSVYTTMATFLAGQMPS